MTISSKRKFLLQAEIPENGSVHEGQFKILACRMQSEQKECLLVKMTLPCREDKVEIYRNLYKFRISRRNPFWLGERGCPACVGSVLINCSLMMRIKGISLHLGTYPSEQSHLIMTTPTREQSKTFAAF
jgi:hypothetical protein